MFKNNLPLHLFGNIDNSKVRLFAVSNGVASKLIYPDEYPFK